MPKRTIERSPSKTAMFAALYRAIAHREAPAERWGADGMAKYFLPCLLRFLVRFRSVRASVQRKSGKMTPGLYEYVLARTAFMDDQFERAIGQGAEQVVLRL
jgi:O-methyltransferase involved in polyketide biosynthesis